MDVTQLFIHLSTHSADTTIITPNRRLAAHLHKRIEAWHEQQHTHAWPMIDALPISTWLERSWNQYSSEVFIALPTLLNSLQEDFLWEHVLNQFKESKELLQLSETAHLIKKAAELLQEWQVDLSDPLFESAKEYLLLKESIHSFNKLCEQKNFFSKSYLANMLADKILKQEIIPPRFIFLVGFTELSPQLNHFFSCCTKAGSEIHSIHFKTDTPATCSRIQIIDEETELNSIALFAKSIWQDHPQANIACIIPSLERIRDRVERIFAMTFAKNHDIQLEKKDYLFNISAGKPLIQYPLIHTALLLLNLYTKKIPIDTFAYLLSSPYLAGAEKELLQRNAFDYRLRKKNIREIYLPDVIDETHDASASLCLQNTCPILAKKLRAFFSLLNQIPSTQTFYEWSNTFTKLLTQLGWPGERSINSEEYQLIESWLTLLQQFSTLDQLSIHVTMQQALYHLQQIVSKHIFQVKSPDAPIQILGVLEAAGIPFDYIWLTSMDDCTWPPPPNPNPFIPKKIQRQLEMPHATAEREWNFCQTLMQQFKDNAKHVIFSYIKQTDECILQPSTLIESEQEISLAMIALPAHQSIAERLFASKASKPCELILDEEATGIIDHEPIAGGVNILQDQALCPFKAFARWRLYAEPLEQTQLGLRAKDRGILMHKALELIWQQLQNHAALIHLSKEQLHALIAENIDKAIHDTVMISIHHDSQYMLLEKKRLFDLILQWLDHEKERPPFNIYLQEKNLTITLNQLTIRLRIDRIDELSNGKKLIIDYKSGKYNEINHWFDERPKDLQLLLYTALDPAQTTGIAFAQITTGAYQFKGISAHELRISGIKPINELKKCQDLSWQQQLSQWHDTLLQLSNDFCKGIARLDPKEGTYTCMQCEFKPLCRIHEENEYAQITIV